MKWFEALEKLRYKECVLVCPEMKPSMCVMWERKAWTLDRLKNVTPGCRIQRTKPLLENLLSWTIANPGHSYKQ